MGVNGKIDDFHFTIILIRCDHVYIIILKCCFCLYFVISVFSAFQAIQSSDDTSRARGVQGDLCMSILKTQ